MTQQLSSRRSIELDKNLQNILEKGQTNIKEQTLQFIKQSGKMFAIAVISIAVSLITGQIIPESLFITTFVIIPLIIFAVIIYFIIDTTNKSKNELRSDLLSLATSHKSLGDELVNELVTMEKRLIGRINVLEAYVEFGILEMDKNGTLIRSNKSFEYMFNYNENTLNQLLRNTPNELKAEVLSKILAENEDVERLKLEFKSRLDGDTEVREIKDLYLKSKNGRIFPATIRTAIIQDKKGPITQYFIADETDNRAMLETIHGQNDTINKLIGAFTKHYAEREFTDRLISELEKSKIDIKTELAK